MPPLQKTKLFLMQACLPAYILKQIYKQASDLNQLQFKQNKNPFYQGRILFFHYLRFIKTHLLQQKQKSKQPKMIQDIESHEQKPEHVQINDPNQLFINVIKPKESNVEKSDLEQKLKKQSPKQQENKLSVQNRGKEPEKISKTESISLQDGWEEEQQNQSRQEEEIIVRVDQGFLIYFLTVICTLLTGTESIFIFVVNAFETDAGCILFTPLIVLRILFSLLMSYRLCSKTHVLWRLYLTVDKIFLTEIVQIVSVTCYVWIFFPYVQNRQWFYLFYGVTYPLMVFTMSGYFRVMMVYCNWSSAQVIIYKISLMFGAVSFFGIGIYYTVTDKNITNDKDPKIDQLVKDIIFLYIFAGFELFNQIFSKVDDVDGTATFKGGYLLENDSENMQLLLQQSGQNKVKNQPSVMVHPPPSDFSGNRNDLSQLQSV